MDQSRLEKSLSGLNLGGIRYFPSTGSTNDEAARWVEEGARDASLVAAGAQTAGRGRSGRSWYSPAGASLSFSLIFYPIQEEILSLQLFSGLGALAVCEALVLDLGLGSEIKWPNDVLVESRKVCGVLAEAHWIGSRLSALILGIGINVARESANPAAFSPGELHYPAISLEEAFSRAVNRVDLLHAVVSRLLHWRKRIAAPEFLEAWEARLAFRGEMVQVLTTRALGVSGKDEVVNEGRLTGLAADGSLKLINRAGEEVRVSSGEVHLRPVN
jgi:BirA family transcriptional regulator, biotin operon repressor / biotin---[acetyl-CoA-carboxylase] ligase